MLYIDISKSEKDKEEYSIHKLTREQILNICTALIFYSNDTEYLVLSRNQALETCDQMQACLKTLKR